MPNIISTLLPSFAKDTVAVFTQDYVQVFPKARTIKATVKEQAKVMEHPVESGAIITDHRVILPVEIELSLVLASEDYEDVYKNVRQYYLNGTLLIVQTRSGVYKDQLIASMPHEEDPTMYSAITIALSLKQVIFVQPLYGVVPKNPKNNRTVNRGTQQPVSPPANTTSAAYEIAFGRS